MRLRLPSVAFVDDLENERFRLRGIVGCTHGDRMKPAVSIGPKVLELSLRIHHRSLRPDASPDVFRTTLPARLM